MNSLQKLPLKLKMPSHETLTAPTLATLAKTPRGMNLPCPVDDRLDLVNQARGDFKETFNMSKFGDTDYQQKLPPILMQHWPEIVGFQKQCHTVTLKVLTLFALALNVFRIWRLLT
jgi:hypothetical protein